MVIAVMARGFSLSINLERSAGKVKALAIWPAPRPGCPAPDEPPRSPPRAGAAQPERGSSHERPGGSCLHLVSGDLRLRLPGGAMQVARRLPAPRPRTGCGRPPRRPEGSQPRSDSHRGGGRQRLSSRPRPTSASQTGRQSAGGCARARSVPPEPGGKAAERLGGEWAGGDML